MSSQLSLVVPAPRGPRGRRALPICSHRVEQRYHALCEVRARVRALTALSPPPTVAAVDARLRRQAIAAGGTAVVDVRYRWSRTLTSRSTLTAIGTAVLLDARDGPPPARGHELP